MTWQKAYQVLLRLTYLVLGVSGSGTRRVQCGFLNTGKRRKQWRNAPNCWRRRKHTVRGEKRDHVAHTTAKLHVTRGKSNFVSRIRFKSADYVSSCVVLNGGMSLSLHRLHAQVWPIFQWVRLVVNEAEALVAKFNGFPEHWKRAVVVNRPNLQVVMGGVGGDGVPTDVACVRKHIRAVHSNNRLRGRDCNRMWRWLVISLQCWRDSPRETASERKRRSR